MERSLLVLLLMTLSWKLTAQVQSRDETSGNSFYCKSYLSLSWTMFLGGSLQGGRRRGPIRIADAPHGASWCLAPNCLFLSVCSDAYMVCDASSPLPVSWLMLVCILMVVNMHGYADVVLCATGERVVCESVLQFCIL